MRHSSTPFREAALQKYRGKRLILMQPDAAAPMSMKRAALSRNFCKAVTPALATFAMARALVTRLMPWRKQNTDRPTNEQSMMSF
ncbi:hypothetical protein [Bradyrhizobium sp. Cp5.3]|uniref:hypothetical protein n=1 Tax=Bradyrhizobium sp. Cp5.3 TaxID=443598 RepID=UPI0018DBC039|nr:hypothetical protein [Bradyrhizobium sp. Cp5.3]